MSKAMIDAALLKASDTKSSRFLVCFSNISKIPLRR